MMLGVPEREVAQLDNIEVARLHGEALWCLDVWMRLISTALYGK